MFRDYRRVQGYESDYIISNYGEVFSLKFGKVRLLKPNPNSKGYLIVVLCKNGKVTLRPIHVLVGIHFVGLRINGLTYDHKDINNQNNRADNLRLATRLEQSENQNLRKDNKLGFRNICENVNGSGTEYYIIHITRNGKTVRKYFRKDKYSLEFVVSERDKMLENLNPKQNLPDQPPTQPILLVTPASPLL